MNKNLQIALIIFFTFFFSVSKAQHSQEWPYELGKPLDSRFYDQIKKMDLKETISNKYGISLLKIFINNNNNASENGSDEDYPEWKHNALIQVNDYYFEFKLGSKLENDKYYKLKFEDIAGVEKRTEIIIESGCYFDAGCLNETFVIFNHKSGPISIIKFDMFEYYQRLNNGEVVITNGMMGSDNSDKCYSISQSYKLSKYSVVKTKTFFKKRKVECVG